MEAVRSWIYSAMLAGVLMHVSAGCTAFENSADQPVKGLCFEHIGPQDKPMPGFCVSAPGTEPAVAEAGGDGSTVQTLQVTPQRWRTLRDLIDKHGQKALGRPSILGDYQVRSRPSGGLLYLPPGATRKLVLSLEGSEGLRKDQAEMLQRLRLRLGV